MNLRTMVAGTFLLTSVAAIAGERRLGVIRDASGMCTLMLMPGAGADGHSFQIVRLLQYVESEGAWLDRTSEVKVTSFTHGRTPSESPITLRLGLFWIKWTEDGTEQSDFVHSGPVLCNDVELGPPPEPGLIAQCIPGADSAKAVFVPDPQKTK